MNASILGCRFMRLNALRAFLVNLSIRCCGGGAGNRTRVLR